MNYPTRMHRLTIALAALGALSAAIVVGYVGFIAIDAGSPLVYRNVTGAMEPALLMGERFTTRPLRYRADGVVQVSRGDLIAFAWPPDTTKSFVKRVVGIPGDTLAMQEGSLLLDGKQVREPYAWRNEPAFDPVSADFAWQRKFNARPGSPMDTLPRSRNNWGPILVPASSYFVLGDNRDNSLDSRYWGFVPASGVLAYARRVYFSRDTTGHIRWSRFGHVLR